VVCREMEGHQGNPTMCLVYYHGLSVHYRDHILLDNGIGFSKREGMQRSVPNMRRSEEMDTRQWIEDNADNNWVLDDTNYDNFIIRKALNRGRGS